MKIQEMHIGQRVQDERGWKFVVTGLGVINTDMDSPYVYCDFEGNPGDAIEYDPDDLEEVKDGEKKD